MGRELKISTRRTWARSGSRTKVRIEGLRTEKKRKAVLYGHHQITGRSRGLE